jgi:hypothetical protein
VAIHSFIATAAGHASINTQLHHSRTVGARIWSSIA